jgi:hypothetical protein
MATLPADAVWTADLEPPFTREEMQRRLAITLTDEAWQAVRAAYWRHNDRLAALAATVNNNNPNDPDGWRYRHDKTTKAIEGLDRGYLREVADIVGPLANSTDGAIKQALESLDFIAWLLSVAEPMVIDTPSEKESKKELARDLFTALEPCGATLTNGWTLNNATTEAELTPFERLIRAEIHKGNSPKAAAKWLKAAIGQANP